MVTDPLTGVGALIYCISTGRYLFLLRAGSSHSGTWGICGGKVEKGEGIMDALAREIREEIGGVVAERMTPIEKFTSDNERFIYHTMLVSVTEEFVPELNTEHVGYCWAKLDELPSPMHPGVWRTISFDEIMEKIRTIEYLCQ